MKLYDKDLLKRETFLKQLQDITLTLSKDTAPHSFAINGKWGCGKSWILEKYEQNLFNNFEKQFIVFHFNAWQNDFYDEPLTAMVTSIATQLNKQNSINNTLKGLFKKVGNNLLKIANELIKEKTKIDIIGLKNLLKESKSNTEIDIAFDSNSIISLTINQIIHQLDLLTENHTIIFIVDELDRCLPEYAIKVLERLHHLFGRLVKSITIIAVDSIQLNETIKNIFGANTSTESYLAKFVDFTISLDNGSLETANLLEHIESYREHFKIVNQTQFNKFFDNFINIIFIDIPVREQINLVRRAEVIHKTFISSDDDIYDDSVMCCELFLLAIFHWKISLYGEIHNTFTHFKDKLKANGFINRSQETKLHEYFQNFNNLISYHRIYDSDIYSSYICFYLDNLITSNRVWFMEKDIKEILSKNLYAIKKFINYVTIIH